MIYLLDVSALIGLAYREHQFHQRVSRWLKKLDPVRDRVASCAITELGLVRILPQMAGANLSVSEARLVLKETKATSPVPFAFLEDASGAENLPEWVTHHRQITDGHLLALSREHRAVLVTFDEGIPGAFVIS